MWKEGGKGMVEKEKGKGGKTEREKVTGRAAEGETGRGGRKTEGDKEEE